ncbi:MAG: BatD family protein [Muribaculum sp.]|nr:BatD family protein [Muribaculum sp.]
MAGVNVRMETQTRGKIKVGDKFYIYIEADGEGKEISFPNPPSGTRLLYSSVSSTDINGRTSAKCVLTLLAQSVGSYSFQASVGSSKSKVLKYTIAEGGGISKSQAGASTQHGAPQGDPVAASKQSGPQFIGKGNENMFLRASVSKTNVYEQEAIVYTIKLYTSYNYIKFLGATAAPKFEGFVVEEDKITDVQQKFETYNGKNYKTAVVARYIIFPQKAGKLNIIGNTYTVSADAFEYYHDPYFQQMVVKRPVQLNITPNDLSVDVKALPTHRPADFSGGVGKFSITSSLPRQNYKTNQAATITYTINGTGNLKYIKLPDLNQLFPSQLEVFTPQSEVEASVNGNNVSGSVEFTYSFMPVETGKFAIPPVTLVYFNPETGKYESAVTHGYNIDVGQGSSSEKSQTAKHFESSLQPVGKLIPESEPWILGFKYWLCFIIPSAGFLFALLMYFRYEKTHSDMEALKSRRAGRMARKRLKKAAVALKRNDSGAFYDEMLAALWGYMAHKLKMPTSELLRDNIREMLTTHNVSEPIADKAISLLDECEFAKYAPQSESRSLKSIYDEGSNVISSLESSFSSQANHTITNKDIAYHENI